MKRESVPEMTHRHYMWSVPCGLWESNRLTFYKTLFARMGNVKAGVFVDDETGESLNDVEKTLNSLGISLRDSKDEFRDFDKVLDDVAAKWDTYSSVQQHALATAFAGKLVPVRTEMCA